MLWALFEVIWTKLNSELNYIWSDMDQTEFWIELHLKWHGPNWILNWTTSQVTWTKLNSKLNYIWSDMDQIELQLKRWTRLKFIPASLEVQWTKLRSNFIFTWSDTDRSKTCIMTFRADYMTSDKHLCVSASLFVILDIIIILYIRKFIHWYCNLVAERWIQESNQIESTIYVFTLCPLFKEHVYIRCDYDLVTRCYKSEWRHR